MTTRKLYVLGPPRLEYNGQPISLNVRKALALLVYLAVTGQPQSRDTLATLLWPNSDQREARARLRRTLYLLAQTCGDDMIAIEADTVRLHPMASLWVDSVTFLEQARSGLGSGSVVSHAGAHRFTLLSQAVDLYTDDFLAGFTLPDSPVFDEWQFFHREQLRGILAQTLEALVEERQASQDWVAALGYARRWLDLDPLHEPAQRTLMRLYALAGQQAAALRQYQECVRLLETELGVTPEPATTALYEAIRTRQLAPPPSSKDQQLTWKPLKDTASLIHPPAQPPPPSTSLKVAMPQSSMPLIGRDRELAELQRLLLEEPGCRLLNLVGPGGIGKTSVALEMAGRMQAYFAHGVCFVPLASVSSPEFIAPTIVETLHMSLHGIKDPMTQLLDHLREKKQLLILDNFEHIQAGVGVVADILLAAPGVKILVTSRERLNLSGETVFQLGSLTYPDNGLPHNALEYGAVQLLMHRARLTRADLDFRSFQLHAMIRICRLTHGMPLALVLAAGWIGTLSFEEIATEIAHNLDFLESEDKDRPDRQRSIRATVDYSWKHLSADEQQTFMRLSVFQGAFTREAAQRVTGAALKTLRTLTNKSLITLGKRDRYEIHPLLRQYGVEKLIDSGEASPTRAAHAEYYLNLVHQREAELKGQRQLDALNELEAELENIRTAWTWAAQQKDEALIGRALEGLYLCYAMRSRYKEGRELLAQAQTLLMPPGGETTPVLGRLLSRHAFMQTFAGPSQPSLIDDLQTSLIIAQQYGDQTEIGFSLLRLGSYYTLGRGEYSTAIEHLTHSLAVFREQQDPYYTATALIWLGLCYSNASYPEMSIPYFREGLQLARDTGNLFAVSLGLNNLTKVTLCSGEYTTAEGYCHEALDIYSLLDHRLGIAEIQAHLALLHLLRGDLDTVGTLAEEARLKGTELRSPVTVARAQAILGLRAGIRGDYQAAILLGQQALTNAGDDLLGHTVANWALALTHCGLNEWTLARHYTLAAVHRPQAVVATAMLTWPLAVISVIWAKAGQFEPALETLALAYHHPLSPSGWFDHWPPLIHTHTSLKETLGGDTYQAAWTRGTRLDLATVVAALLS